MLGSNIPNRSRIESRMGVPRVRTGPGAIEMTQPDETHCRWCGELIERPKRGQKFCSPNHRYRWHKAQQVAPGKLEDMVRAIVREELARAGFMSQVELLS